MVATPRVILGTMTIGGQTSQADAAKMLLDFCDFKWSDLVRDDPMVDTAIMYQGGETEAVLGRIMKEHRHPATLSIASKANPFTRDKNLSPSGVRGQLESSLRALQLDSVDIFYLHAPDPRHDIEPTLEEVQKMHLEKKFNRFALSNFAAWEVVYIHGYMSSRNYILPTIYQGMYNAITREVEHELFPALRKLKMSFYAYNPLAGGMLCGKYTPQETDDQAAEENAKVGGRFAGNAFWAKRYRERYQQKEQFEALGVVRDALGEDSMADASLRWMMHHSKLGPQDGVIMGASNALHYVMNMESLAAGPLSDDVVEAFDKAARICRDVCPSYARGYSGSALERSKD